MGATESVVTGADGKFRLEHLPAGETILIVVSASGFESMEQSVLVTPSRPAVVDFRLALGAGPRRSTCPARSRCSRPAASSASCGSRRRRSPRCPASASATSSARCSSCPGVSGSNETSSGLYVRGGTPDQTLVTYDGFTVYHVDHLFGYYSAFNMDAVEDVELRKGAYEARYGGRLSSVLELRGRSGPTDRWSGTATASMLSVGASVSMPIAGRGSLLLAGRRSFQSPLYNNILDLFGTNGNGAASGGGFGGGARPLGGPGGGFGSDTTPSSHFYDLNGRFSMPLGKRDRLELSTYGGRDNLDNSSSFSIPEFSGGGNFPGGGTGADLHDLGLDRHVRRFAVEEPRGEPHLDPGLERPAADELIVAGSRYEKLTDRQSSGEITITGDTGDFPTPGAGGLATPSTRTTSSTTSRCAWSTRRSSGNRTTSRSAGATRRTTSLPVRHPAARHRLGPAERGLRPSDLSQLLNRSDTGALLSGYVQDQARLGRLTVTPGLRLAHFDRTGETYVEPRLSFGFQFASRFG